MIPGRFLVVTVFLLTFWDFLSPFMAPGSREAKQGARSYDRGAWEQAVDHYTQARRAQNDPALDYNLGASAYRDSSYQAAADAFAAAQRSDALAPGRAAFNLGNARFQSGDLKDALEAYRAALRADPDFADARYNYELTRKELQVQSRNQDQKQQGKKGNDKNQKGQGQKGQGQKSASDSTGTSKSQPSPGDQNKKGQEKNSENAQNQERQKEQAARPDSAQRAAADTTGKKNPAGKPGQPARLLTPQEAAQLLNQITPEERELLQARLKATHRRKAEKDW
jgi:Ca-activated chloride channel family protein